MEGGQDRLSDDRRMHASTPSKELDQFSNASDVGFVRLQSLMAALAPYSGVLGEALFGF